MLNRLNMFACFIVCSSLFLAYWKNRPQGLGKQIFGMLVMILLIAVLVLCWGAGDGLGW